MNFLVPYPEEGRRKPYRIGEDGFDYLIRKHIEEIYRLDVFAEYCCDYFPLVFGYWDELKENGLDDYVKNNLSQVVDELYVDVFRDLALGWRRRFSHTEFIEALYVRLYLPEAFWGDERLSLIPFEDIVLFRGERADVLGFIHGWLDDQIEQEGYRLRKLGRVKQSLPKTCKDQHD